MLLSFLSFLSFSPYRIRYAFTQIASVVLLSLGIFMATLASATQMEVRKGGLTGAGESREVVVDERREHSIER